jgi:hypothetical protein
LAIDPAAAGLIPPAQARLLGGCVIGIRENGPLVVVADPTSERLDALRAQLEDPGRGSVGFAVVTGSSPERLHGQLARISPRRTDPGPASLGAQQPATDRESDHGRQRQASRDTHRDRIDSLKAKSTHSWASSIATTTAPTPRRTPK